MKRVSIVLVTVAAALLATLRFGNTQWSRAIYIFQAYVQPGGSPSIVYPEMRFLEPPGDFTGRWIQWHRNGRLLSEGEFREGKANGKVVFWRSDGTKAEEGLYIEGVLDGEWDYWRCGEHTRMLWQHGEMIEGSMHGVVVHNGQVNGKLKVGCADA